MTDSLLKQLKDRRKELGITQSEMARRLKITQPQYQKIESSGNPSLKTLNSLALALDLKLILVPKEKAAQVEELTGRQRPAKKLLSLLDQFEVRDE